VASGSFNLTKSAEISSGAYIIGMIKWSSTADTTGNKSSVTATLYCKKAWDEGTLTVKTGGSWAYSLTINGSKKTGSATKDILTSWVKIASYTVSDIAHSDDGSKNITIAGSVTAPVGTSYEGLKTSGSKSVSLDTIPRASSVGATDANIGSKTAIIISRASSSFTHTITYAFGDLTGTIATKTAETSVSWTVPTSFYAEIPNDTSGECTITCTTYNNSTEVGTDTCTFTATAAKSVCAPVVSVVAADANAAITALTGSDKRLVKGFSNVDVVTNAKPQNSSKISSVYVECGSIKRTGEITVISGAESATIKATATDSRGYSSSATASGLSMANYFVPTLTATVKRESPTSDVVNITAKGKWFNDNFGAVANTLSAQVKYKLKSQSEYTTETYADLDLTISGDTYTAKGTISGLSYTEAYSIRVRVSDAICQYNGISSPIYANSEINKGIPIFDWGESDFQFNVPVRCRSTGDADESSNGKVAIRTGLDDGQHIDIDTNEIMAKESATELGDLSFGGSGMYFNVNGSRAFKCDADGNESALPLTVSQGGYAVGGQSAKTKIYAGQILITPTEVNTPTTAYVAFPEGYFTTTPIVCVSPRTTVPEKCSCGYYPDGTAGTTIYMTRTNTTSCYVAYICIGF
jgi:hypothetical protein